MLLRTPNPRRSGAGVAGGEGVSYQDAVRWIARNGFDVFEHNAYRSLLTIKGALGTMIVIRKKDAIAFAREKGWEG